MDTDSLKLKNGVRTKTNSTGISSNIYTPKKHEALPQQQSLCEEQLQQQQAESQITILRAECRGDSDGYDIQARLNGVRRIQSPLEVLVVRRKLLQLYMWQLDWQGATAFSGSPSWSRTSHHCSRWESSLRQSSTLAHHDHQIGATLGLEHFEDLNIWLGRGEGPQDVPSSPAPGSFWQCTSCRA